MNLANLDLSSALASTKKVCTVEVVGILEGGDISASLRRGADTPAADIANVSAEPDIDNPRDIKKIRAKHHSVARLIASGVNQRMVAKLSGYSESYLSILLGNPSMVELVQMYQSQLGSAHQLMAERLRTVADEAVGEIEDRLANPEQRQAIDINELLAVAKLGLDRSGHGPQSSQHIHQETHVFDHAELRRRDRAARNASADRIIENKSLPAPDKSDEDAG